MKAKDRLIVALDVPSFREAGRVVRSLKRAVATFKVGLELFTSAGPKVVSMIHDEGGRVFLDLKFHDIPNTVAKACEAAARLDVFMMNIHVRGGEEMMIRALQGVRAVSSKPLLLGVTVLTSDPLGYTTKQNVVSYAKQAKKVGLNGVVCSALEAADVRRACGPQFAIVTPGIRPRGSAVGDQKRVMTPQLALKNGADYLVVGRPILEAEKPLMALENILEEIQ